MIVDPDFTEHWKTRMLVGLLGGDESAPVYVLRLWSHCQNRKQATFESLNPDALKALCRFTGCANDLEKALATAGFIRRSGEDLEVVNWTKYNASLVAAWINGRSGGRPKANNPRVPKTKPMGSREEKSREEKSREEETPLPPELQTDGFASAWKVWKRYRAELKKPLRPTMEQEQLKMLSEIGEPRAVAMIRHTIAMGWQGLREPEQKASQQTSLKGIADDL
jgi:hypothetical protein